MNIQKGFSFTNKYTIGIGTRTGIAAQRDNEDLKTATFNYLNNAFTFGADHTLVIGAYYTNTEYAGTGTVAGVMAGVDLVLKKDKVKFLADVFSGDNALSVINAGFEFSLYKKWSLTLGGQVPVPGSENESAAVIQISKE
jgi:hypothetical protein